MALETLKEHITDWLGSSRNRIIGCGLFLLAGYLFLSLVSYSSVDPSFNHASNLPVANWGGEVGAFIADMSLQFVGLACLLLVIVPLAWGWRLFTGRSLGFMWLRVSMFFISLVTLSIFFAFMDAPVTWPIPTGLGGAIGALLHDAIGTVISPAVLVTLAFLMSVMALLVVLGLSWAEWKGLYFTLLAIAFMGWRTLTFFRRTGNERATTRRPPRRRQPVIEDEEDEEEEEGEEDEEEDEEDEEDEKPARRFKGPVVEKLAKPSKAAQASFELQAGEYEIPPMGMLSNAPARAKKNMPSENALAQNAKLLESVLQDFGVYGEITKVRPGPVVTLYELEPSPGTRSSRVVGLSDDIARSMSAVSARIAVISGASSIGIELPNNTRETVYLREMFESEAFQSSEHKLPLALGKDIGGAPIITDLARMPHLLVAGTTGSGKSVAINTMIMSLLYRLSPDECKFIMIDPKMLELSIYDDIPHLLCPVVTEPGKAVVALKWTVKQMEERYRLMASLNVRNIDGYNKRITEAKAKGTELTRTVQTGFDPESGKPIIEEVALDMELLPYIVVVVDEMADLMLVAGKDIEGSIQRLAQMARAAGIHIIMATQRPSVDVITGVIKANFPTRISFQVTSKIDSRTILGEQGAEQLLGQGDMLYMAGGGRITRVHGPFISDKEVEKIVSHVKTQGSPQYMEEITRDEEEEAMFGGGGESDEDDALYAQAVAIVRRDRKASTSYIQRCLKLGYNRAARLIERMEREGIVGPANHVGKREVLIRKGE